VSDGAPTTTQLTLTEVLLVHELLIETFGGMRGVNEHGFGKLEAAVAAPSVSMFGDDLYVGLAEKAGVLFYRLVRAHGFSDGNKRVALVALILFLQRNDARLRANDDELYMFTMAGATEWSREQVTAWIEDQLELAAD